jgi:uridine kinase
VIILDGAYSARPELADIIDVSVLIEVSDRLRRERLRVREGEAFMKKWHAMWDSAEDYYFSQVRPKESFDLVIRLEDSKESLT